jgi:hypothetical protein
MAALSATPAGVGRDGYGGHWLVDLAATLAALHYEIFVTLGHGVSVAIAMRLQITGPSGTG